MRDIWSPIFHASEQQYLWLYSFYFAAEFARLTWQQTPQTSPRKPEAFKVWLCREWKRPQLGHRSSSRGQPLHYLRFSRATSRRWQVLSSKVDRLILAILAALDRPLTVITPPPPLPPFVLSELSPRPLLHKSSWHRIVWRFHALFSSNWLESPGGHTGLPFWILQHPRLNVISEMNEWNLGTQMDFYPKVFYPKKLPII